MPQVKGTSIRNKITFSNVVFLVFYGRPVPTHLQPAFFLRPAGFEPGRFLAEPLDEVPLKAVLSVSDNFAVFQAGLYSCPDALDFAP